MRVQLKQTTPLGGQLGLPEQRSEPRGTPSGRQSGSGRPSGRGLCSASRRTGAPTEENGLHVNPGPGKHHGFQAAPDTETWPRSLLRPGRAEGKGITLKKWMVMSCVRAPPWEQMFLCKTVQASERRAHGGSNGDGGTGSSREDGCHSHTTVDPGGLPLRTCVSSQNLPCSLPPHVSSEQADLQPASSGTHGALQVARCPVRQEQLCMLDGNLVQSRQTGAFPNTRITSPG